MATVEECQAALERLAGRLGEVDHSVKEQHALDRSLSCQVPDLGVTFAGRLRDGHLQDITTDSPGKAQIRLTMNSDDLVALTAGELSFASSWARGRIKVEASMIDLLKLRSML